MLKRTTGCRVGGVLGSHRPLAGPSGSMFWIVAGLIAAGLIPIVCSRVGREPRRPRVSAPTRGKGPG